MKDENLDELNFEACASLMLYLERSVVFLADGEIMAVGVWLKLENNFMTKTLTNLIYLKAKIYTCKY